MAKRRCSNCGRAAGHYRSTCPKKKNKTGKGAIRRYSTGSVTRSRKGHHSFGGGAGWIILWHFGRTHGTQHDKTWAVKIAKKGNGWTVVTRHGRRTGEKNETTRAVMSKERAINLRNSLINQKLRKGYIISGANR